MANSKNLKPPFSSENQPARKSSRKGIPNRSTVLKKWLSVKKDIKNPITKESEKGTFEDEIVFALINQARQGNVAAFREVMDTVYGKNSNTLELANKDDKPLRTETIVILPKPPEEN